MKYGERLKKARKAAGLTQDGLSKLSRVPQGTISKIERGDQDSSTYDTVLADTLGVSAIWLTSEKGKMSDLNTWDQGVNEERDSYGKKNEGSSPRPLVTDEQFNTIVSLLKNIDTKLGNIDKNTEDLPEIRTYLLDITSDVNKITDVMEGEQR